jgi:hypothetical protein
MNVGADDDARCVECNEIVYRFLGLKGTLHGGPDEEQSSDHEELGERFVVVRCSPLRFDERYGAPTLDA